MRTWILVIGVMIIVLGLSRLSGNLMPESDANQTDLIVSLIILGVGIVVSFGSKFIPEKA